MLLKQKKCKDCGRGGRVDRWRRKRKGERKIEDEGEERGDTVEDSRRRNRRMG